jgi:hypothetical protein
VLVVVLMLMLLLTLLLLLTLILLLMFLLMFLSCAPLILIPLLIVEHSNLIKLKGVNYHLNVRGRDEQSSMPPHPPRPP